MPAIAPATGTVVDQQGGNDVLVGQKLSKEEGTLGAGAWGATNREPWLAIALEEDINMLLNTGIKQALKQ